MKGNSNLSIPVLLTILCLGYVNAQGYHYHPARRMFNRHFPLMSVLDEMEQFMDDPMYGFGRRRLSPFLMNRMSGPLRMLHPFYPMAALDSWDNFFMDPNEVKDLQKELYANGNNNQQKEDSNQNNIADSDGHSFIKSSISVSTPAGVKTHEVKKYITSDGKEIKKEIRRLGDQAHEVTSITSPTKELKGAEDKSGNNAATTTTKSNIEGIALEDFNKRWEQFGTATKKLESGVPVNKDSKSELESLREQLSQLQAKIKTLEAATTGEENEPSNKKNGLEFE